MIKTVIPGKYEGRIAIPSSKSDGQRAILAAALAKGTSTLHNTGNSKDEQSMLEAIRELGAEIEFTAEKTAEITGIQQFPESAVLNMHESGLGVRLMTSVCAAHTGKYTIIGNGSSLNRPMYFFEETLPLFNTKVTTNNGFLPLEIEGKMKGSDVTLDGSQSSQYISGMMMALPLIDTESRLTVNNLKSIPYLQMTLNTLAKFGISILHQNFEQFIIAGQQKYLSTTYTIEGDWSSASYWLVASALGQNITVDGLSMYSLQADKAIIHAFETANCTIHYIDEGIQIHGRNRKAFQFDATHCPDLFPALVTFAAFCDGRSDISGVHRLTHKESNRGTVLKSEFEKIGVNIVLDGDVMHVYGKEAIEGGKVNSHNDHRIAMCLAIAGMFSDAPVEIEDAESVGKSYLDFWKDLEKLDYKFIQ